MPVHYFACAVARFVARNTTPRSATFVCVFAAAFMWQLQVCSTAQLIWLQMNVSTREYKTFGRFSCDIIHNTIKHCKNRNRPTVLISLLQTKLITLRSVKLLWTSRREKWWWTGDILLLEEWGHLKPGFVYIIQKYQFPTSRDAHFFALHSLF
jgi:hypothetical protein